MRLSNNSRLKVIQLDLSEIWKIPLYINDEVDSFYHLAWEGARAPQRDNCELQQTNYECAIEAIKAAIAIGCGVFVGAGSQAEYGKTQGFVTEALKENPTTMYGKAKLKAFKYATMVAGHSGMRVVWPRIFSIYGAYDFSSTLIMSCIDKMRKNESVNLTECTQLWDFLYIEDAVSALIALSETKSAAGVYNVAYGKSMPLKDYVLTMKKILRSKSELRFGAIKVSPENLVGFSPSVDKILLDTKWKPSIGFADGIQNIIKVMDKE